MHQLLEATLHLGSRPPRHVTLIVARANRFKAIPLTPVQPNLTVNRVSVCGRPSPSLTTSSVCACVCVCTPPLTRLPPTPYSAELSPLSINPDPYTLVCQAGRRALTA